MSLKQDPDLRRSASHLHMKEHLIAPLQAGAVDTQIPISDTGEVTIVGNTREPLLVVAPAVTLNSQSLRLEATLPDSEQITLEFAPYTEEGAFLPLYRPQVDSATQIASPFTLSLSLVEIDPDGTETSVVLTELTNYIQVRLIEGIMGRMLYLMGAEKQRIRRQGREIIAMRSLSRARDDALDRMGVELGVPRFTDTLAFQDAAIVTASQRESDQSYRQRLEIYRPWLMPNYSNILTRLNGIGTDTDPNQGLISSLGVQKRFQLLETDNKFAVAIHLVASGQTTLSTALLNNFNEYIRAIHLVHPSDSTTANNIHNRRYLPSIKKDQITNLRSRLRSAFQFGQDEAISPLLATALDRLGRCRRALGINTLLPVFRTQDLNGGSRYQLGLGVEMGIIPVTELEQMRTQLLDPNRSAVLDQEVESLLKFMTPKPASEDPEGHWLLKPCGLQTIHRLNTNRLYLSHLPTFGMAITGSIQGNSGQEISLEVRYHAPGDPGSNIVLIEGLQGAESEWTAIGGESWTVLTDTEATNLWQQVNPRPASDPALGIFRAVGLIAVQTPNSIITRLERLPGELIETIRLSPSQAARILAGDANAISELQSLMDILRQQGIVSILPLITNNDEVLLVLGVIGLPEAGINLAERRATGFRWYVIPIEGEGGEIKAVGSRTVFIPKGNGLSALVAIGYARRGSTDPYEFRVELPDDARLNLLQYEFLMNLLQHSHPLGVEVNTFSIRQHHVDLDGDGNTEPLPPNLSKTYRQFRRDRVNSQLKKRRKP